MPASPRDSTDDDVSGIQAAANTNPNSSLQWLSRNDEFRRSLAGIGAGSACAFLCAPLDLLRTRMQIQGTIPGWTHSRYSGFAGAVRTIWLEEGLVGFFRGYGVAAIIVPSFWGIYFPVYNKSKTIICGDENLAAEATSFQSIWRHGASALVAAGVTDVATNPLWVVRTRLQTQHLHVAQGYQQYRGVFDALKSIIRLEGVLGLWKGLTASLMGASHAVLQFPAYEALKKKVSELENGDVDTAGNAKLQISTTGLIAASVLSKLFASMFTYPHEVVRARLQDQRQNVMYKGAIDGFRVIYRQEGLRGLYSGFGVNLIRTIPACAITFVAYEHLYEFLDFSAAWT